MELVIVKWDGQDMEDVPWHVRADVPLMERRKAVIEWRLKNGKRIWSTVMYSM